jgi:fibronectin type 3 domain-containing protein
MARRLSQAASVLAAALVATLIASTAQALVVPREGKADLASRSLVSSRTAILSDLEPLDSVRSVVGAAMQNGWEAFRMGAPGEWQAEIDQRSGRLEYAEGGGIPWVPGRGNSLGHESIAAYSRTGAIDLATMEATARAFLPGVADMMGVDRAQLVLNQGRSGQPASHVWFVDFDVVRDGLVIEGARVVFRVNNGNLIQFGTENLPAADAKVPARRFTRAQAREALGSYLGGFEPGDSWVDRGSLHLLPVNVNDEGAAAGYRFGQGRGLALVWQFSFHREGQIGTWLGRVDATSGEVMEFYDANEYGSATGGTYPTDSHASEPVRPLPFTNVATGVYTNSAGLFSGTTGTTTLNGQYVRISDSCGSISKAADANGLIALGTSGGTDCTTPGSGGAGNTHASRTQFYAVNRAKEVGRGWLPSNSWLNAQLTVNVNLNQTCNAYWNGSSINFFRSGGGCGNTGELPGVSLHEYGHGLDSNDGNSSSTDNGTGETYGDFTAALATHSSCVGNGFLTSNCGGYGNACTSCTGVRDIDWAKHTRNTPSTVANFTQTTCPQPSANNPNYVGPCGKNAIALGQTTKKREGHCESYVSSEALWDLANRDMPSPGSGSAWAITDRLWYLSRSTSTAGFQCDVSGTTWTSNGCFTGSYFRTLRAVDDDNGNLADGTPHGGALAAAFNRHGIACTTDTAWNVTFAGVTPPASPALTVTAGNNSAALSWSGSSGVYDVYRNEAGCNAGFTKVANDLSSASYNDTAVANGFTYYYQVVAQPFGNEAAASAPSTCQSVVPVAGPCTPPAAPTGVTATATSQSAVTVSWTASAGATSYAILRSTTSGGPYTQVGTSATTSFSNTGLSCNTTYYYVVQASNGTCSSASSAQAQATTQACTGNVLTNGVPVTGISGAAGSQQFWTMAVPSGATNLSFVTSGGSGDADLYVKFGSAPTTSSYDCRSWGSTNAETCNIATAQAGTYHVLVNAYAAFSGMSLTGSYSAACTPPAAPTGVSASATGQTSASISWTASAGATSYTISRSSTSGGPYSSVGTDTASPFSNTGLSCGSTYYYVVSASNGTCSSANSAQAAVTTQACSGGTELVTNGGFESGTTPWVMSGSAFRSTGTYPHTGVAYSYLGNANSVSGQEYQQISIPAGTSPSFTFWLNVTSAETTTTTQYDKLFIEVRNSAGTLLSTLATYSNLNKASAGVYSQKSFSLASWAGQTVRIQFRTTTDSSLITTFRVDDVSVK